LIRVTVVQSIDAPLALIGAVHFHVHLAALPERYMSEQLRGRAGVSS
jgi:hypothetical protein